MALKRYSHACFRTRNSSLMYFQHFDTLMTKYRARLGAGRWGWWLVAGVGSGGWWLVAWLLVAGMDGGPAGL